MGRVQLAFVLILGICCLFTACEQNDLTCEDRLGCIEIGNDEPISLGALLPLSEESALLGEEALRGIEFAIADHGGGILDHPIELTAVDSLCQADEAGTKLTKLLADNSDLVGIIGPICSSVVETVMPGINQAGLVMISPANTAVFLTNPDTNAGGAWQAGYFRTAPHDTRQSQIIAEFAYHELNARTAAVIFGETPNQQEFDDSFVRAFRQLGGVVTFQGSVPTGATSPTELLVGATASQPDVLYLSVLEPEGNLIVNAISRMPGLNDTYLIGGEGLFVQSFPMSVGSSAVNGMYLVGPAVQGAGAEDLRSAWQTRFGVLPTGMFYGQSYDAANLLLAKIEMVAQASSDGRLLIGRQALRDALTQTAVFPGVTGSLSCSPYGDCAAETAVGIYRLSMDEINGDQWPPELVWVPET